MNWAKGRKTRGRGTSFRGALQYALHDKGAATRNRVGFIELRNLAADDPDRAWSEMMALCDAADDLKRRAGVKATGRKQTKPVYAFTLNWHEDDKPAPEHMRATAIHALNSLGMGNLQAVIVEHTDRPHRHVHVIVNLVDPDTGKSASLSNDEHKLDRWADEYERMKGVIRSPDRRAKFEALDNGRKPPKRPPQAKSREEWEAVRIPGSEESKARAADIRAAYAAKVAALKAQQSQAFARRRTESDRLWTTYKADRKAVMDRYQPFINAIWKKNPRRPAYPYTEQALHDMRERSEWSELGKIQFRQRRQFSARERSALGVIANIVRLHHARIGGRGIRGLFRLAMSGNERRRQFDALQEGQRQALRQKQTATRTARTDILVASRNNELAALSRQFEEDRKSMVVRHAGEAAAGRAEWKALSTEQRKVWADHRAAVARRDALWNKTRSRLQVTAQFQKAVRVAVTPPPKREQGAPSPPKERDAPAPPRDQNAVKGWRARRSAAERKADGSYRPRDRGRERAPSR